MIRFCFGADRGAHWKTAGSFVVAERHRAGRTRALGSIAFGPSQPGSSSSDHSGVGFRRDQSQRSPTTGGLEPDRVPLAQEMVRSGPCRPVRRGEARAPKNPRRRASSGASTHRPRQQARRRDALDRALRRRNDRPFEKHSRANLRFVRRTASPLQTFQAVHRSGVR